jgi:HEAT repeat protein
VRRAGVELLTSGPILKPEHARAIIDVLGDEDAAVRQAAVQNLSAFPGVTEQFFSTFQQMLASKNPGAQASAIQMLQGRQITVPREVLLSLLKSSDVETLDAAWTQLDLQGEKLSDDEAPALLENRLIVGRLLGLDVLAKNPGKQSVELAMPFLRDPDELVRLKATETLQTLTGQHFTEDQADEWIKWWEENKTHFTAERN